MKNVLSKKNYSAIKEWLENNQAPEPEFAESFMTTMYFLYMKRKGSEPNYMKSRRMVVSNPWLKKLMEGVENKVAPQSKTMTITTPEKSDNPNSKETVLAAPPAEMAKPELKASIIGKAIRHCARIYDVNVKDSHIQIILYVLYGNRLAKEKPDIFHEIPQMWKYGPVFPSSFSSLKKPVDVQKEYEAWRAINQYDADLATHIINLVMGLGERRISELTRKHTASGTPWHECRKKSPDKWGIQIPASEIKRWFQSRIS